MKYRLLLLSFLVCSYAQAQDKHLLDSLTTIYQNNNQDTIKILVINEIAYQFRNAKPDTTIALAQKSLLLSEKINYTRGQAWALNRMGMGYNVKSNYSNALYYFKKSLALFETLQDKKGIGTNHNRIGIINNIQGNYDLALIHNQKALKIAEEINDKHLIGNSLNDIGNVYNIQQNYELALEYYLKSLAVRQQINDKRGITLCLNNIGAVYNSLGKHNLAVEYYTKALLIQQEANDKRGITLSFNNLGRSYQQQQNYDLALEYYFKSKEIKEEIKDKQGIATSLTNIAQVFEAQKNYKKSIEYAQEAFKILQEINAKAEEKDAEEVLYRAYKMQKNYGQALFFHELYKITTDSLFNKETAKFMANAATNAALEKKEQEILLLEKNNQKDRISADKQKIINYLALSAIVSVIIFTFFVIRSRRREQKASYLLASQHEAIKKQELDIVEKNDELIQANEELQQQQEELRALNQNIASQKDKIEQNYHALKKTTEQLDKSIQYASHIQEVIMPSEKEIKSFFSDCFVIYKPKEVVSGDFYWFANIDNAEQNDRVGVFVLADCTGHGVSGALMSMLGCTLLHEIINNKQHYQNPALVLRNLHKDLRKILKQEDKRNRDGMDISVCMFKKNEEKQTVQLVFAGAKSRMCYVLDNKIVEIMGDRQYLGGEDLIHDFTNQYFELPTTIPFYLFSDGYADQANVAKRPFGFAQLEKTLLENATFSFETQKENLLQHLANHQQNAIQRDDISVIGLKV